MKKKIVSACAAFAAVAAIATTVESSNTFGVLKVDTGNTDSDTSYEYFIGVPWVTVGGSAETIDPTSLVLPTQLAAGDLLYVYNSTSGKFAEWKVNSGATAWESVTVSEDNATYESGSDSPTVTRGNGIVVKTAQQYIYLSGQYSSASKTVTVSNASAVESGTVSPVYTLISAGFAEEKDLLSASILSGTPASGDMIVLSTDTSYTYDGTNWKYPSGVSTVTVSGISLPQTTYTTVTSITLAAGRAAWYSRVGTSGTITFTFSE